jgi:hypothetical protein
VVSFIHFREKPPMRPETVQMQIRVADNIHNLDPSSFLLSPDGCHLAFVADGPNSQPIIWIRELNSLESRPLLNSESKSFMGLFCWSPDSRFIAFRSGGVLLKIDITSGLTKFICVLPLAVIGGSWNRDDEIILGMVDRGIMHVPAAGGDLIPLTILNSEKRKATHSSPTFLSDGRHFLYACSSEKPEDNGIFVGSLDSKPEEYDSSRVLPDILRFKYVSATDSGTGYLLYLKENTLMAQLFHEKSLQIIGEPFPVAVQVGGFEDTGIFTVSNNGILVYQDISRPIYQARS